MFFCPLFRNFERFCIKKFKMLYLIDYYKYLINNYMHTRLLFTKYKYSFPFNSTCDYKIYCRNYQC